MSHTDPPYYIVTPENDVHGILAELAKVSPGSVQIAHRNADGEIKYVCIVHDGHMPAKENAAFIVRACNNNDLLINAIEQTVEELGITVNFLNQRVQKAKQ